MPPRKNEPLSAAERMRLFRERKAQAEEGRFELYLPAKTRKAEEYIKLKCGPERVAQLVQWVLETEAEKIRKVETAAGRVPGSPPSLRRPNADNEDKG